MKKFNASNITKKRKQFKKTQFDIAKETNISITEISNIERNKKIPRADTLIKLADALKCSINDFFE